MILLIIPHHPTIFIILTRLIPKSIKFTSLPHYFLYREKSKINLLLSQCYNQYRIKPTKFFIKKSRIHLCSKVYRGFRNLCDYAYLVGGGDA